MKYYLAYGSNLNLKQMEYRCPTAKVVGATEIIDYELEFRLYLTIKQSKGKVVPVGIFSINEADERSLDRYEGYPNFYYKKYLPVTINGKQEQAMIYIMRDNTRNNYPPTPNYWQICKQGYLDFKLNPKFLMQAYDKAWDKFESNYK